MLPYARLSPGKGFEPLRAALYYSQRLAVVPAARSFGVRSIASAINLLYPRVASGPLSPEHSNTLSALRRDGLAPLPPLLPPERIARLVARLGAANVSAPDGTHCRLDQLPAGTPMAPYPLRTVLECEDALAVANDPGVLRIAGAYLHCTPTISSIGIRWSLPDTERHGMPQRFHRDVDDWRSVKLFIYLTDVDEDGGPHLYVRGSHRTSARLRARPYGTEEVEQRFGPDKIEAVTGPRGTSFLADVFGIHRGMPPRLRPRLILQVQYSVLPVYAFSYMPLDVAPQQPVNGYINRLLIKPAGDMPPRIPRQPA